MELALSLGHQTPKPNISFLEKKSQKIVGDDLGFCMAVGTTGNDGAGRSNQTGFSDGQIRRGTSSSDSPPVQLDLLPFSPVNYRAQPPSSNKLSFPWLNQNLGVEAVERGMEINLKRNEEAILLEGASNNNNNNNSSSSPNSSTVSSFQMNFSVFRPNSAISRKRGFEKIAENNSCELLGDQADRIRGSDDDDNEEDEINGNNNNNNMSRKKLRLTKEQSAFLEDSFKEHNTLNPKQKVALAKQLNLRPRQVEVWFQNRRARTKLKQTEVDCEYLKRWCETLTQENKKLHKELSELKALNSHPNSFFMQLPPTTLTMCPSCERVAPTTTTAAAAAQSPPTTTAGSKHFSLSPSHIAHAQHAS